MKHLIRLFVSLLVPALMLAFATATPAMKHEDKAKDAKAAPAAKDAKAAPAAKAEKGKPVIKELYENDKVRVFEVTFRPGDTGASNARPFRVIRALKGGTLTLIYADGKTEKRTYKTGEVKVFEADKDKYALKNEGKSDMVIYAVFLKEPKK